MPAIFFNLISATIFFSNVTLWKNAVAHVKAMKHILSNQLFLKQNAKICIHSLLSDSLK